MKRTIYYEATTGYLFTEREVKQRHMDKREMRRYVLPRDEIVNYGMYGKLRRELAQIAPRPLEFTAKELSKADVRRDLMRLGIIW